VSPSQGLIIRRQRPRQRVPTEQPPSSGRSPSQSSPAHPAQHQGLPPQDHPEHLHPGAELRLRARNPRQSRPPPLPHRRSGHLHLRPHRRRRHKDRLARQPPRHLVHPQNQHLGARLTGLQAVRLLVPRGTPIPALRPQASTGVLCNERQGLGVGRVLGLDQQGQIAVAAAILVALITLFSSTVHAI